MKKFLGALQVGEFNNDQPAPFGLSFESHDFAAAHDEFSAIPGDDLRSRFGVRAAAFPSVTSTRAIM